MPDPEMTRRRRRLRRHLQSIAKLDPDVEQALNDYGYPAPRVRGTGFEQFLSIIISQQVSTGAAASIQARVFDTLGTVSAEAVKRCPVETLRAAGMSGRKVEYAKGLADAILTGGFDPESLENVSDEDAIAQIVALRGFGPWSAEIYLMFSLGRNDIFAADDLALQIALQRLKGLAEKPTAKQSRALVEHWAPWRSAGCLFLWHCYRGAPT